MRSVLKHPACHLAAVAALCLLAYGRALSRGFVSEDFFVLRRFAAGSLWETAWAHLTGPLLEISFVKFYRPVSAFLAHLEYLLWGTLPAGYLVTHLAVHGLNAVLVYRLAAAWSRGNKASAAGVTLIFAVYPLHPNAVLFVAAFATLFGATFLLASLVLYEHYRTGGGARCLAGSLVCFALALGSYEQTVVLPVFVAARELLAAWEERGRPACRGLRGRARPVLPFFTVLLAYFLVRRAALGETVAGYEGFQERLSAGEAVKLGHGILVGLARLIYPSYDHGVASAALWTIGVLVILGTAGAVYRGGAMCRFWTLGWLWILASQAPFVFAGVVPGNGRYWYLTSIGLGLAVAAAADLLAQVFALVRPRPDRALVVTGVTVAVGIGYFFLLTDYTRVYAEAGRTASAVRSRLAELPASAGGRVFVTGYPDFLRGPRKTPIAQVFFWGLSDALAPPFAEGAATVYPLPPLSDAELSPLLERADLGTVWRWLPASGALEQLELADVAGLERLPTRAAAPGELAFHATAGSHRLVLLARGSASTYPVTETADAEGWIAARLPEEVVRSWRHLYDGEIFAWIEARRDGRLVAVSRLQRVDSG